MVTWFLGSSDVSLTTALVIFNLSSCSHSRNAARAAFIHSSFLAGCFLHVYFGRKVTGNESQCTIFTRGQMCSPLRRRWVRMAVLSYFPGYFHECYWSRGARLYNMLHCEAISVATLEIAILQIRRDFPFCKPGVVTTVDPSEQLCRPQAMLGSGLMASFLSTPDPHGFTAIVWWILFLRQRKFKKATVNQYYTNRIWRASKGFVVMIKHYADQPPFFIHIFQGH